jgi:hypothetical protein
MEEQLEARGFEQRREKPLQNRLGLQKETGKE